MNGRTETTGVSTRPRYPVPRTVVVRDEVYDFGLWFPTVTAYEEFLRRVEQAHRRRDVACRIEQDDQAGRPALRVPGG